MTDFTENLFEAINILAEKKIETIKFDETVAATIVDASKADKGEYVVSTGNVKFIAYGTETKYREKDTVMVTIPQGNYDNQKIIIGKQVDENTDSALVFRSPFVSFVDATKNLVPEAESERIFSVLANDIENENIDDEDNAYWARGYWPVDILNFYNVNSENKVLIWDSGQILYQDFTHLGVKADFQTFLNEYATIYGNYGLGIELTFTAKEEVPVGVSNHFVNTVVFDSDDFFGNVYNFATYFSQEQVFNLSDFQDFSITNIKVYLYQRGNFLDNNAQLIPHKVQFLDSEDSFIRIADNIYVKNLYISLGVDASTFVNDTATLISVGSRIYYKNYDLNQIFTPLTYETGEEAISPAISVTAAQKEAYKLKEDVYSLFFGYDSFQNILYTITEDEESWYQIGYKINLTYTTNRKNERIHFSSILGTVDQVFATNGNEDFQVYYQEENGVRIFLVESEELGYYDQISYPFGSEEETLVVNFIEPLTTEYLRAKLNKKEVGLRWIHKDEKTEYISLVEPQTLPSSYEIRWYRYKVGSPAPDQFVGAHWMRFYGCRDTPDSITGEFAYTEKDFEYQEVVKTSDDWEFAEDIIYYTQNIDGEYNEISLSELTQPYVYIKGSGFSTTTGIYVKIYTAPVATEDLATNQLEISFLPNVSFASEKIKAIILKYEDSGTENFYRQIAATPVLEFLNNTEVRNNATFLDLNALSIRFEDDEKGNYFLYNRAGSVGKEDESNEIRGLTAVFDLEEQDIYKKAPLVDAYSIKWTFPTEPTMIRPAAKGYVVDPENESLNPLAEHVFSNLSWSEAGYPAGYTEATWHKLDNPYSVGFFIKEELNRNATNNTVQLEILKDGEVFFAQAQMRFGTAGTSGSDYTIILDWDNGQNAFNASEDYLAGSLFLMDQSGEIIDLPEGASWDCHWYKTYEASLTTTEENEILSTSKETRDLKYPALLDTSHLLISGTGITIPRYCIIDADDIGKRYQFDLLTKTFTRITGSFGDNHVEVRARYATLKEDVERFDKLVFKPIDIVVVGDTANAGIIEYDAETQQTTYYYSKARPAFIQYDGMYIIDPWGHYLETEVYYYPALTEEVELINKHAASRLYISYGQLQDTTLEIEDYAEKVIVEKRGTLNRQQLMNSLYIFEAVLTGFGDYDLKALFPLPIKFPVQRTDYKLVVDYIEGATDVRYATTGETDFNKNVYQITAWYSDDGEVWGRRRHGYNDIAYIPVAISADDYDNNPALYYIEDDGVFTQSTGGFNVNNQYYLMSDIQPLEGYWKLIKGTSAKGDELKKELKFIPELVETGEATGENGKFDIPKLDPPSVYFSEAPLCGVTFITDVNGISHNCWTQPILMYQDNYPSTTLNKWTGKSIETDEDTGTILANGMAAGKKELDNTFTGVVLGDWSRTDTDPFVTAQTGVYGFNHGAMSYALKDDGTAFFGKDGKGRLYLNGNKAQIYSAAWKQDKQGMLLDIDDGSILIHGPEITWVEVDGALEKYDETNTAHNDLEQIQKHAKIQLSPFGTSNSPYFLIKDEQDRALIKIQNDAYYLQTGNFNTTDQTGTKIDLSNGKITSYDFTLNTIKKQDYYTLITSDAYNDIDEVYQYNDTNAEYELVNPKPTWKANTYYQLTSRSYGIYMNSGGKPYLQIKDGDTNLIYIRRPLSDSTDVGRTYYLQSFDYNAVSSGDVSATNIPSGLRINLATGKLTGYNCAIKTYHVEKINNVDTITGLIFINSGASTYPFQIGTYINNTRVQEVSVFVTTTLDDDTEITRQLYQYQVSGNTLYYGIRYERGHYYQLSNTDDITAEIKKITSLSSNPIKVTIEKIKKDNKDVYKKLTTTEKQEEIDTSIWTAVSSMKEVVKTFSVSLSGDDTTQKITMTWDGKLYANNADIMGTIRSSTIIGTTIESSYINSGEIVGATIRAGNISAGTISGAYITGAYLTGTLNAGGGTISGGTINGGTINGGTITGGSADIGNFYVDNNGNIDLNGWSFTDSNIAGNSNGWWTCDSITTSSINGGASGITLGSTGPTVIQGSTITINEGTPLTSKNTSWTAQWICTGVSWVTNDAYAAGGYYNFTWTYGYIRTS